MPLLVNVVMVPMFQMPLSSAKIVPLLVNVRVPSSKIQIPTALFPVPTLPLVEISHS